MMRIKQTAGVLVLLLATVWLLSRGHEDRHRVPNASADFQTLYGMTRCLLAHCDPYNADQDRTVFTTGGGVPAGSAFAAHEPLYLPPALVATIPFALLPWHAAELLWRFVNIVSFLIAAWLMAELCFASAPLLGPCSIAILLATSTMLIILDQPAMVTIGLLGIAVWCFLRGRAAWLAECCMGLSLAYKPHIGGLIWLYFLMAGGMHRRRAMRTLMVTSLIYVPALLWATLMPASAHWMAEMPANVAALSAPGQIADVGPTNPGAGSYVCLQSMLSILRNDPRFYNGIAHLVGGALFLAWAFPVLRMRPSREKDLFAIASIACISLLPIYHHDYDTRLLLLLAPAFALSLTTTVKRATLSGIVTLFGLIFIAHAVQAWLIAHHPHPVHPGVWSIILWTRTIQTSALGLALFYLYLLYQALEYDRSRCVQPG